MFRALAITLLFATYAIAQQPAMKDQPKSQPATKMTPAGDPAAKQEKQARPPLNPVASDNAPAKPEATLPSVFSANEEEPLTADPNAPFWKDIKGVWIEKRIDTAAPAPQLKTDVRSRWTNKNLYFLFVCPYVELNLRPDPQTEKDTMKLWENDTFELYIGSNFDDITKYHEMQISPQGEHLDMKIDATRPVIAVSNEQEWESGWKVKARLDRENKVWYGEAQIPIASIDPRPVKAGNEFRANLYRLQGPNPPLNPPGARRDFVAWQPTMEYQPHRPLKFGRVKLVEKQ